MPNGNPRPRLSKGDSVEGSLRSSVDGGMTEPRARISTDGKLRDLIEETSLSNSNEFSINSNACLIEDESGSRGTSLATSKRAELTKEPKPRTSMREAGSKLLRRMQKTRTIKILEDKDRQANLRMSLILFVISMVFVATFTPALLMAHNFIRYNVIIFYSYFVSSVTNPIFYCFLNRNFRNDFRRLLR